MLPVRPFYMPPDSRHGASNIPLLLLNDLAWSKRAHNCQKSPLPQKKTERVFCVCGCFGLDIWEREIWVWGGEARKPTDIVIRNRKYSHFVEFLRVLLPTAIVEFHLCQLLLQQHHRCLCVLEGLAMPVGESNVSEKIMKGACRVQYKR